MRVLSLVVDGYFNFEIRVTFMDMGGAVTDWRGTRVVVAFGVNRYGCRDCTGVRGFASDDNYACFSETVVRRYVRVLALLR